MCRIFNNYKFKLYDFGSNYFYSRHNKLYYYFGYQQLNLDCKNELCSNILENSIFQFYYSRFDYLIDKRDIFIDPNFGYYFNLNFIVKNDFKNKKFNHHPG